MARPSQLGFEPILEFSFRQRQAAILRYCRANGDKYRGFAEFITPDRTRWESVWDRLAFAILSANVPFADAVAALGLSSKHRGDADPRLLRKYRMVPAKAEYLNRLPLGRGIFALLRQDSESWDGYRVRLRDTVPGLGLTKASFAACLLYPLEADLACVDTHMQKVYLRRTSFGRLSHTEYLAVESKIRKIADAVGCNTFLAQWQIWDHARGVQESHAIFPGAHKGD